MTFPADIDPETSAFRHRAALREAILDLLDSRGPGKTICPSEAARVAAGDDDGWRTLMDETRSVAAALVAESRVVVTRKGEVVDIATVRGPIRLRIASRSPAMRSDRDR